MSINPTILTLQPISEALLRMDKPLQDEIISDSGVKFFLQPDFRPEWNATSIATLYALPSSSKYKYLQDKLSVGDELAFDYQVCADIRFHDDAHYFHEATEGSPYFKKFFNGLGEMLTIVAMPKTISTMWVGAFYDSSGDFQHGCQGTQSEVERWQSNFHFGSDDSYTFKNLLDIDGEDYWRCNVSSLLAKKVGDEIISIGDRLILSPIDVDIKTKLELLQGKSLPFEEVKMRFFDRATLVHDAPDLGFKKGDIVSFETQYLEKYVLWGKEYFIVKKSRALGLWQTAA